MESFYEKDIKQIITIKIDVVVFEKRPLDIRVSRSVDVPNREAQRTERSTAGLSISNLDKAKAWLVNELDSIDHQPGGFTRIHPERKS